MILAGGTPSFAVSPADSIPVSVTSLDEIIITTVGSHKILDFSQDGSISLDARFLSEQPSLMGSKDPVSFIKTLPAALTTAELQPGLLVRGSSAGSNYFETDGARIINPMHMLGLYSAFNPNFYKSYSFYPGCAPASESNATGGVLKAYTAEIPDTSLSGIVDVGLVESNLGLQIPIIKGKSSLALGYRKTYVNMLFPNLLRLGDSHLKYGFTDINAGYTMTLPKGGVLKGVLFMSRDDMSLRADKNGDVEGDFGWKNLASGLSFSNKRFDAGVSFTLFNNKFLLSEGGRSIFLPSSLLQTSIKGAYRGNFVNIETDINLRHSSGQRNEALTNPQNPRPSDALEWNIAADRTFYITSKIDVYAGLRMAFYHNAAYNKVMPLPRVRVRYAIGNDISLSASYGRFIRFDRLIEETTGGLPADFWTNASRSVKPEDVNAFELGAASYIPFLGISCNIDLYYKLIRGMIEFDSSIIDFISPGFQPLDHLLTGNGVAYGCSVTVSRQFGAIRGRVSYNYGRSMVKIQKFGTENVPASFDRPHDLSATISWNPTSRILVSATFTHATGTPYTAAKYGYMIGENLICEYFPHNSSRLPAYNRLDLGASWMFLRRGHNKHTIRLSIYNALAMRNVLFIYTDYSIDKGIRMRKSTMSNVIPSLSYSIEF
jgi:hypothetical protein